MLKNNLVRLVYLCGLSLLVAGLLPATASNTKGTDVMFDEKNPAPYRKVEVQKSDKATIQLLHDMGMEQILTYRYDETLWKVPTQQLSLLTAYPNLKVRDQYDSLGINGISFYPLLGEPAIPEGWKQIKQKGYQLWLVKYEHPYTTQPRDWLKEKGYKRVGEKGNTGYLLWLDGKQLEQVETTIKLNSPFVWAGPYHSYYRLDSHLRKLIQNQSAQASKTVKVTIILHNHSEVQASIDVIKKLTGSAAYTQHFMGTPEKAPLLIITEIPLAAIITIANLVDVQDINFRDEAVLHDEMQGQIIAGNSTAAITIPNKGI